MDCDTTAIETDGLSSSETSPPDPSPTVPNGAHGVQK
jgi:hypothetical protein